MLQLSGFPLGKAEERSKKRSKKIRTKVEPEEERS